MDEPLGTLKQVADAVRSVSETAHKGLDVIEAAGAFLSRLLGADAAGIFKDGMFYYRARNAVRLQDKLDKLLLQRRIENPRAIPLRLAIPFLEAATLEDDETLQQRWACLLANAMDLTFCNDLLRQYGEVLKVVSPQDCLVLEAMNRVVRGTGKNVIRPEVMADDMKLSRESVHAALYRLKALGLVDDELEVPIGQDVGAQPFYRDRNIRHITAWGRMFLAACSPDSERESLEASGHD